MFCGLSPKLVWTLIVYAGTGTLLTTFVFGRPLVALNFFQLRQFTDFRYSSIRVRENAESIAFYYRGEDKERNHAQSPFSDVIFNTKRLVNWQFFLNSFQSLYTSVSCTLPASLCAVG